jgi:hypothetical protein
MGATHSDAVQTEMNLHVLAYNIKRMIRIFGVELLMAAIIIGNETADSALERFAAAVHSILASS